MKLIERVGTGCAIDKGKWGLSHVKRLTALEAQGEGGRMMENSINVIIADMGRMASRIEGLDDSGAPEYYRDQVGEAVAAIEEAKDILEKLAERVADEDGGYDV